MELSARINTLLENQKTEWPMCGDNYSNLDAVRVKSFSFDGFSIKIQFNPKRITSSAAKVDPDSIQKRPCFLCASNRPAEQKGILISGNYEILCNPFPIFPSHFTVSHLKHIPQEIGIYFSDFLDISKAMKDYVVFYNASNCGASAPDHLHFQAGNTGFLPIETEWEKILSRYGKNIVSKDAISVSSLDDGLRKIIILESDRKDMLLKVFKAIHHYAGESIPGMDPMLNILSWYCGNWKILIFPREKHRPWQYFREGKENILLSPASVDMGGLLITPLEKDFEKIQKEDIRDIFSQVCINSEKLENYSKLLINAFK